MAFLTGTPNNDVLTGTFEDDTLQGLGGNDTLIASSGFDTLDGGAGNDTADYGNEFGAITLLATGTVNKFLDFSFGTDQLVKVETIIAPQNSFFFGQRNLIDASTTSTGVSVNVNLAKNSLIVNGVPGLGTLNFTVKNFVDVVGTAGNDSITGNAQDNRLIASGGNDTLNGGDGFDTADYTNLFDPITLLPTGTVKKSGFVTGTDQLIKVETIIAPSFSSSLIDASTASAGVSIDVNLNFNSLIARNVPGFGNQSFNVQNFTNVIGTNGNDSIGGDFQSNSLSGGAGDDTLIASGGFDTLDGGAGNDTADYSQLFGPITLLPTGVVNKFGSFGFGETDQLVKVETIVAPSFSSSSIDASSAGGTTSLNVNLANNSLIVNNVPGLGTLSFTVKNFTNVTGTAQKDSIIGDAQSNSLNGSGGNDSLVGGDGDDFLNGDDFSFFGGPGGSDTLDGGDGNDFLHGGGGNDKLIGGAGNDSLNGDEGSDTLVGGQGNDFLNGDFGGFPGSGSTGTDTADYSKLGQAITLEAVGVIDKGTAGTDQIQGIETIIGATRKANAIDGSTGTSNSTFFDIDLSINRLDINDVPVIGTASFKVLNFVNATGTSQDDSIFGNSRNNAFQGGRGDDTLSGEGGADMLLGEDGSDTLTGGAGNDTLVGGNGADTLRGGAGADKFQFFNPNEGIDTILDFVNGSDKIVISLAGFGSGLTAGLLSASRFVIGAAALDANDRFVFNAGKLFFDRDGSGGASQKQIATLTGLPTLAASDISIA